MNIFSFPQFILRHTNAGRPWMEDLVHDGVSKTNTTHEVDDAMPRLANHLLPIPRVKTSALNLIHLLVKTTRETLTPRLSSRRPSPFEQLAQTAEQYSKTVLTMGMS